MEAEQALRAARSRILKRISFLSPVLEVVEWREQDGFEGIGTDGRFLLYGKAYVREIAVSGGNGRLEREYLHAVCHIICRHPSQCPGDEAERKLFGSIPWRGLRHPLWGYPEDFLRVRAGYAHDEIHAGGPEDHGKHGGLQPAVG